MPASQLLPLGSSKGLCASLAFFINAIAFLSRRLLSQHNGSTMLWGAVPLAGLLNFFKRAGVAALINICHSIRTKGMHGAKLYVQSPRDARGKFQNDRLQ